MSLNTDQKQDTIFALATPPGVSGVAVLRVSGPLALQSLAVLADKKAEDIKPRFAYFGRLKHPVSRETIDEALWLYFKSPASFTGEDVVEYHLHGSMAVISEMLDVLAAQAGHRMAEPGEFTRRAYQNDKMDLTKAEAVADLIHAETQLQKQQALRQMGGALNKLYEGWREDLARSLAYVEADLDFPDEDLPDGVVEVVRPKIETLAADIAAHLNDNRRGERLRSGVKIAVIGAPNAGKSSLVNALAQRDVAIVSQHAGTTRDVIEAHLDLGGYPVIIADTAGLRPEELGESGQDGIEAEGIRRALDWAAQADIKLLLFDAGDAPDWDKHSCALIDEYALVVVNKIETLTEAGVEGPSGQDYIGISVQSGQGMDQFLAALTAKVKDLIGQNETPALTRQRHRHNLQDTQEALGRALAGEGVLPELVAEDIRIAMRSLGRITGRVDVEDLLDIIFKDFCIGK